MKGQTQIISIILILGISVGLMATAYTWGLPLIQKRQDTAKFEAVFNFFDPSNPNSLERKIVSVANRRGEETLSLDFKGVWSINENENSISFSFLSRISGFAEDKGIPLVPGGSCPSSGTGKLGIDEPFDVCGYSKPYEDRYNITFKVWFRELVDEDGNVYRIKISPLGSSSLLSKSLLIKFGGIREEESLIETKINILLQ